MSKVGTSLNSATTEDNNLLVKIQRVLDAIIELRDMKQSEGLSVEIKELNQAFKIVYSYYVGFDGFPVGEWEVPEFTVIKPKSKVTVRGITVDRKKLEQELKQDSDNYDKYDRWFASVDYIVPIARDFYEAYPHIKHELKPILKANYDTFYNLEDLYWWHIHDGDGNKLEVGGQSGRVGQTEAKGKEEYNINVKYVKYYQNIVNITSPPEPKTEDRQTKAKGAVVESVKEVGESEVSLEGKQPEREIEHVDKKTKKMRGITKKRGRKPKHPKYAVFMEILNGILKDDKNSSLGSYVIKVKDEMARLGLKERKVDKKTGREKEDLIYKDSTIKTYIQDHTEYKKIQKRKEKRKKV